MLQVVRDSRGRGAEHSEDESDSDSDYEDAVEGTLASPGEDAGRHSEQESEPTVSTSLATGAFST